jgi:hypothetical protein
MKMKDSKTLLLNYLASVRDPERAASLFADDGVFELPFLRSLGVEPRYTGRREISALVRKLLEIYPNFAFAPDDTRILIETPDKTFAEYVGRGRAAATGRTAHHLFTGYLVAEAGRIKLLRESFNPLTMAQAQLPNGVADIGPPRRRGALFLIERETPCAEPSMQPGHKRVCSSYQLTFVL